MNKNSTASSTIEMETPPPLTAKDDVRRLRAHKSIQERFKGFTGTYEVEMIDWGLPAGKEVW
jgi:hypothetical protein